MVKLRDGREFDETQILGEYKYNVYRCGARHLILSCDIDEGVTPMWVSCRLRNYAQLQCKYTAESSMYPARESLTTDLLPVKLVWRKPTAGEYKAAKRDNWNDHFDKGGLQMEWIN